MVEISLQAEGLPESGSVFRRRAARGIAAEQGMLLLIHTDAGDYKFPGGGVEPGETLEQALAREMLEETGHLLTVNSGLWGVAHERRPGRTADILEMDSFYFLCRVGGGEVPLRLDDYEEAEHFRPVWVSLLEALSANRALLGVRYVPWLDREIRIMEALERDGRFS